jgi:hypothetical protein
MNIHQTIGIVSRSFPVTIRNYWLGQRPMKHAMPDIARLHSIPEPLKGARNIESWTLLNDLAETDSDIMALLHRDTRKQVRRAEREGISIERYDCQDLSVLNDFDFFYNKFSESKSEVRDVLKISVQLHMLKKIAKAGMLQVSRAMGRDGEPLVYHVIVIVDGRARLLHTASLFREDQSSEHRHYLGWASRYLHAQNMLHYKRQGYFQYDWGGWYAGRDNESLLRVNRFKEEFGGKVVCEYDVMVGCSFRGNLALRAQDWFRNMGMKLS